MSIYQTMIYQGEKYDERYGWEFGKIILFTSTPHENPTAAMEEFTKFPLPDVPWFAYMRVTENGEIIDEEMFDSSCIQIP